MDEELWAAVVNLQERWFHAEGRLKHIEILGNSAYIPAMNQLRYAGRSLAHILCKIERLRAGDGEAQELWQLIGEANDRLATAEADVLDAAITIIEPYVRSRAAAYGFDLIQRHLPRFGELDHSINLAVQAVVASRGDIRNRERHYAEFYENHFQDLIEIYEEFIKIEDAEIIPEYQHRERRDNFDRSFQRWGGAIAVIGLFYAAPAALFPRFTQDYLPLAAPFFAMAGIYSTKRILLEQVYRGFMTSHRRLCVAFEGALYLGCVLAFLVAAVPGFEQAALRSWAAVSGVVEGALSTLLRTYCR